MTTSSLASVPTADLETVASSFLRRGVDARAARLFRGLGPGAGPEDLAVALGTPRGEIRGVCEQARLAARRALEGARTLRMASVGFGQVGYPEWLAQIVDPPIVLWVLGDFTALDNISVAVVGSRRPSPAGTAIAQRLSTGLSRAGFTVTSGLAAGIDGAAHEGALAAGGPTIAVLGSGLDVIYPKAHDRLAARVAAQGCLVSEFPPGTGPRSHHFPLRNRVISGLSRAVVVVEAAERSGSLITARMALEQGRGVCAVPGNVVSGCHKGCHALIKDGARLVETVEDVLEEVGWDVPKADSNHSSKSLSHNDLLAVMTPGLAATVDELAARRSGNGVEVLRDLSTLELEGRVERLPGGWFVRLD